METPYTNNFDLLVAVVTHLGATHKASRTPTFIARKLGFEKDNVVDVLGRFPGFFRKSRRTSKNDKSLGDHFYTLHLRYSRRKLDKEDEGESQPLSTEEIGMLVNLIARMVEQEQENSRTMQELKQSYKNLESTNKITMVAAIVAAMGAIVAALV
ncbi:MAG: hypothetical protein ACYSSO_14275 [Planctomycetota bacterium]|jgi:hypothetical protein